MLTSVGAKGDLERKGGGAVYHFGTASGCDRTPRGLSVRGPAPAMIGNSGSLNLKKPMSTNNSCLPAKRSRRASLFLTLFAMGTAVAGFVFLARGQDKQAAEAKPPATDAKSVSDVELRKRLTPLQYHVTRENGTEPGFQNEYWNNHRAGIYVDVISGDPLFSSIDKFESGTGWPSFTKPIGSDQVVEKVDHFGAREIRSKSSGSHLGHVFDDGPAPTHLRYCMNSAALRFVPVEKLKDEKLDRYLSLFEAKK
jgi:methionine-R-sulfoxide reductase